MGTDFFKVNGIQVANIHNDSEIALFGIAVLAGSNYEKPETAGISHFVEHMFFKGTERRDWRQITTEFAKLGVNNNAYTWNNEVFYHTTCPKNNIEPVIDLMLDMFFHSTIPEEELEKERGVIIEEKKMYDDDPKSAFSSAIGTNLFEWEKGHDTIGTFETIKSIKREQFIKFLEDKINLGNLLFICSGDIDSDNLKKYISERVPSEHPYLTAGLQNQVGSGFWNKEVTGKDDQFKLFIERDSITQANISMMGQNISAFDNCYPASIVLMKAIGGGMYSKLFTRIREELGLCYTVGMVGYPMSYPDFVTTDLYSYLDPSNIYLFIEEAEKILDDVVKNGIDEDLFECAKVDYLASVMRNTESSMGKASFSLNRCLFGKKFQIEDGIKAIDAVTRDTVNQLAERIFTQHRYWAVMVPEEK